MDEMAQQQKDERASTMVPSMESTEQDQLLLASSLERNLSLSTEGEQGKRATGSKRAGRGAVLSGLTHECGVFGAIATGEWPTQIDVAQVICLGLVALQHRGQESAGIVTSEGNCAKNFNVHKGKSVLVFLMFILIALCCLGGSSLTSTSSFCRAWKRWNSSCGTPGGA